MPLKICITFQIILFCMMVFIITYEDDKKDFNKGICRKCNRKLKRTSSFKCGIWSYECDCSPETILVFNPYLNLRYGCKLKKAEEQ